MIATGIAAVMSNTLRTSALRPPPSASSMAVARAGTRSKRPPTTLAKLCHGTGPAAVSASWAPVVKSDRGTASWPTRARASKAPLAPGVHQREGASPVMTAARPGKATAMRSPPAVAMSPGLSNPLADGLPVSVPTPTVQRATCAPALTSSTVRTPAAP